VGIVPLHPNEEHANFITVPGETARLVTPENTRNSAVEAWYIVLLSDFANEYRSDSLFVNVDFQPPGGFVPPDHQASINPALGRIAELDAPLTPDQDLQLHVPNWAFMAAGDKLYLRWGSHTIGPTTIGEDQVGRPVPLTVPWSIVSTVDGGNAIVDYYVMDLVGNNSRYSTGQRATSLPRPLIPEADDVFLDGGIPSATLVVPSDATLLPSDMVQGFFANQSLGAPLPATPGAAMSFTIPGDLIKRQQGTKVAAYYRVSRAGSTLESAHFEVAVIPVTAPTFAAPDIPERNGSELDGTLPGATVRVLASEPLKTGDTVEAFFADKSLGSRAATPQVSMDFPIQGADIAANQGKQVAAIYRVTRAADTYVSQALSILVSRPSNPGWDLEYNFDNDRIREAGLTGQLHFPETGTRVMSIRFDLAEVTNPAEKMGVERYPFTPTPEFKGNVLYVGHPPDTSHYNVFFVDFAENWDVVRLMITSVDRDVTVSFKDEDFGMISGVITVPGGDVTKQHEVLYDDRTNRRIRHMEIRAKDVVRFDSFKFRRGRLDSDWRLSHGAPFFVLHGTDDLVRRLVLRNASLLSSAGCLMPAN
jgi:hypothetical protein